MSAEQLTTGVSGDGPRATKQDMREFWQAHPCGEIYASGRSRREQLEEHSRQRYMLEPYIPAFARFEEGSGNDVLEIGVGMGADHLEWARHDPRRLFGIDITAKAVELTEERMRLFGFQPQIRIADAEDLPFEDASFDIVYSWGVLHHTPDTQRAIREVRRVLRPGGRASIMIYHHPSLVGWMLWARYSLCAGKPLTPWSRIYCEKLESPGTKAYSVVAAKEMFRDFSSVTTMTVMSPGDALEGAAGQRHQGTMLTVARRLWPRTFLRRHFSSCGLFLLIEART